ncbi:hypothetical protein LINPERPRIM_LOCUS13349 [Linum perenne]
MLGKPWKNFVREGLDVKVCVLRDAAVPCPESLVIESEEGESWSIGIIGATTRDYKGTKKIWSAKGGGNRTVQTEKEDPILSLEQRMTNEVTQVTTPLVFVEAEEEQAIHLESDVPENSKMSKTLKRRLERKKKKSAQKALTDSLNNVVNPAGDGDHLTNDTRLPSEIVDTKGSGTKIESQPTEDTLLPDTLPHVFVELLKKTLEDSLVEKEVMHHGSMECVIRKWTSEDECDAVEGKTASKLAKSAEQVAQRREVPRSFVQKVSGVKTRHKNKYR